MPYIIFKITYGNKVRIQKERNKGKPLSSGHLGREAVEVHR